MVWKRKEYVILRCNDIKETRITIYESERGHVIKKDHDCGYFFENRWFFRLKDAKDFVERKVANK